MGKTIAFDSKEFNRGVLRPFYTPVGAGVVVRDADGKHRFEGTVEQTKAKYGIRRSTKCLTYRDFALSLGRNKSLGPIKELIEDLDGLVEEIHYFYVLTRLTDIRVYGRDMPEEESRETFLERLSPAFVLSSAWKYFAQNPTADHSVVLDHFSSEVTGGAQEILARGPSIHIRGDECNYMVNLADLASAYFDLEFDNRNWRVNETDPRDLFPSASFKVTFNPITTRDFHAVTPLERRTLRIAPHVRHPVIFFINEARPDELKEVPTSEVFDEMTYRNPVWHRTLNLAYDLGGCAKLMEPREDIGLIEDGDILIHTGTSSKHVADYFHGQFPNTIKLKASELFDDEKMGDIMKNEK